MRLGLIGPTYPFRGGIAAHTTLLERALRQRHEVTFVGFSRQYPSWLYPGASDRDETAQGLRPTEVLPILDSLNPWTWFQTARLLVRREIDALVLPWWVTFWAPQYLAILSYLRAVGAAPVVFYCHNVLEHEASLWKNVVTRTVLGQGCGYLCQSEEERRVLEELFPGRPVEVVAHPTYEALAARGESSAPGAGKLHQPPRLLFFGFVRPYKGLDVLLQAMQEIHEATGASLHVAGEAWRDREIYERMVQDLGLGSFVDLDFRYVPASELPDLLAEVDLVVAPYRSATGSGVVQLAFGAGLPVVATRVGGLPAAVEQGRNGLLVDPEEPDALARAVVSALQPEVWQGLRRGVEETRGRFSWEGLVERIEEVIFACRGDR